MHPTHPGLCARPRGRARPDGRVRPGAYPRCPREQSVGDSYDSLVHRLDDLPPARPQGAGGRMARLTRSGTNGGGGDAGYRAVHWRARSFHGHCSRGCGGRWHGCPGGRRGGRGGRRIGRGGRRTTAGGRGRGRRRRQLRRRRRRAVAAPARPVCCARSSPGRRGVRARAGARGRGVRRAGRAQRLGPLATAAAAAGPSRELARAGKR